LLLSTIFQTAAVAATYVKPFALKDLFELKRVYY